VRGVSRRSARPLLAPACAVLAVLAVAAAALLVYARLELLDPDRFADRADQKSVV